MMNRHIVGALAGVVAWNFLALFMFTGCLRAGATDAPTENQGANAMAAKIREDSNGLLRLVKFTKINGQKGNINGISTYTMDCSVEMVAVEDCAMTGIGATGRWDGSFAAMKTGAKTAGWDQFNPLSPSYAGHKQLAKNDTFSFNYTLHFDLSERGWRTGGRLPEDKPFVPDLKVIGDTRAATAADEWADKAKTAATPQERAKCYQQAFRAYQVAADAGNPAAMCNVGVFYQNGFGVTADARQAAKWFMKAAEAGNAQAMGNLGCCYATGEGVSKDEREAVKWYQRGADAGNPAAMCNLGTAFARGLGVTKDYHQAVKWYEKAADAGISEAMMGLGACYGEGWGVPKDETQAMSWIRRAADTGNTDGMVEMGFAAYFGRRGVPRDYAQSAAWLRKALDAGSNLAMVKIRAVSAANLRGICQSAVVYANDHNNNFPPHMAALVTDDRCIISQFVRPGSGTSPMTPLPAQHRLEDWPSIRADLDSHCDYIYAANGLKSKMDKLDKRLIVAYEKPWNADGLTIVFGDVNSEWVTRERLPEVLAKDSMARGGARLSIRLPAK